MWDCLLPAFLPFVHPSAPPSGPPGQRQALCGGHFLRGLCVQISLYGAEIGAQCPEPVIQPFGSMVAVRS